MNLGGPAHQASLLSGRRLDPERYQTLLVHGRYLDDHNTFGAYCAATLLMGMAVVALTLMTLLDRKRTTR